MTSYQDWWLIGSPVVRKHKRGSLVLASPATTHLHDILVEETSQQACVVCAPKPIFAPLTFLNRSEPYITIELSLVLGLDSAL